MIDRGERLAHLRREAGLTQAELARISGVSDAAISLIESGKRGQSFETAIKFSFAFGITLDYYAGMLHEDTPGHMSEFTSMKTKLRKIGEILV